MLYEQENKSIDSFHTTHFRLCCDVDTPILFMTGLKDVKRLLRANRKATIVLSQIVNLGFTYKREKRLENGKEKS